MTKSLIGLCGLQVLACLLGMAAGLVPGFSYTGSFWELEWIQVDNDPMGITSVRRGSPADEAGLQRNDRYMVSKVKRAHPETD